MRGDLPEWALRLSSELPSRRHEQRSAYGKEQRGGDTTGNRGQSKFRANFAGSNRRPVIVEGKEYASIKRAADALEVHHSAIIRLISEGKARYAKESHQRMVGLAKK